MTQRMKHCSSEECGLILIEAVIAIGVLTIMFAGVLSLFTRSLVGVRESSDQLIATYLAQDAAEYIRAKIAYNSELDNPDWREGVSETGCPGVCEVDTTEDIESFKLMPCDPEKGCMFQLDGTGK